MDITKSDKQVCHLCGSDEVTLYMKGGDQTEKNIDRAFLITDADYHSFPDIYQCRQCQLIFSDQQTDTASPLSYYRSMRDPDYQEEARGRVIPFESILHEIEQLCPKGTLLDVGAATGIFLNAAKNRDWHVYGVEPSEWAVQEAQKRFNVRMFTGTVDEAHFEDNSFTAVVLLDVIEHVTKPRDLLLEIQRILHPDGILVVTTPNIGSPVARILGRKWWHIRRAHQYYFTERTIRNLLDQTGFKVVRKKYYPWAFSLHYWMSRFENFNRVLFRLFSSFEETAVGKRLERKVVKLNFFDSFELYCKLH